MSHHSLPRNAGWIGALLLVGCATAATAATGLRFLNIGAGARAVGIGNAVVSQVDDASAVYWNPGALPLQTGWQAEVMHNQSFQDMRYEFAAVTGVHGPHGLGLSFHGVWSDRMPGYDVAGEYVGDFGFYDVALGGSYGLSIQDRLGLGVTVSYLREAIDIYTADGFGLTCGAQVRDLLPRTSFGVAVLHLGSSFKFESESFDLPMTVQGGLSHRLPLAGLSGSLLVSAEARKVRDEDGQLLFGTEYSYQNLARLSVGYRTGLDTEDVSLGFGMGSGRISGQYAYVPFSDNLGEQHRISIRVRE